MPSHPTVKPVVEALARRRSRLACRRRQGPTSPCPSRWSTFEQDLDQSRVVLLSASMKTMTSPVAARAPRLMTAPLPMECGEASTRTRKPAATATVSSWRRRTRRSFPRRASIPAARAVCGGDAWPRFLAGKTTLTFTATPNDPPSLLYLTGLALKNCCKETGQRPFSGPCRIRATGWFRAGIDEQCSLSRVHGWHLLRSGLGEAARVRYIV